MAKFKQLIIVKHKDKNEDNRIQLRNIKADTFIIIIIIIITIINLPTLFVLSPYYKALYWKTNISEQKSNCCRW